MKKVLLSLSCFAVMASAIAQDCSKIFISEYVEGVENNKALEIYNPTDQTVDLSEYFVARVRDSDGMGSLQAAHCVQLTGMLAPKSTHVGVLDKRNPAGTNQELPVWPELQALADAFYCPVYNTSSAWYWNGNDAVALIKGSASNPQAPSNVLYDIFGKHDQGVNDGWSTVSPYDGTSGAPGDKIVTDNYTLVRKSSIKRGLTIQEAIIDINYVFNPLEQWDSFPAPRKWYTATDTIFLNMDTWNTLGSHACECDPASLNVNLLDLTSVKLYPNPTTGQFKITGIENAVSVVVYNALGQAVEQIENNTLSTVSFDLSEKSGIYLVKITDKNGRSATQKVVVK